MIVNMQNRLCLISHDAVNDLGIQAYIVRNMLHCDNYLRTTLLLYS